MCCFNFFFSSCWVNFVLSVKFFSDVFKTFFADFDQKVCQCRLCLEQISPLKFLEFLLQFEDYARIDSLELLFLRNLVVPVIPEQSAICTDFLVIREAKVLQRLLMCRTVFDGLVIGLGDRGLARKKVEAAAWHLSHLINWLSSRLDTQTCSDRGSCGCTSGRKCAHTWGALEAFFFWSRSGSCKGGT